MNLKFFLIDGLDSSQNLRRREILGECFNTDIEAVETFRNIYGDFLFEKRIQLSHLYNLGRAALY